MKKKIVTLMLISILSVGLLAGCKENDTDVAGDYLENTVVEDGGSTVNITKNDNTENKTSDSSSEKNENKDEGKSFEEVQAELVDKVQTSMDISIVPPAQVSTNVSYEIPNDDTAVMNCTMNDKYTTLYATKNPTKSGVVMLESGITDWVSSEWNYGLNDESIVIHQEVSPGRQLYTYSFEYNNTYYCFCMEDNIPQAEMGEYLDNVLLTVGAL